MTNCKRSKDELARHDAELDRLINEMHDPKTTAHLLRISKSHAHHHYKIRGMRRGYLTDEERLRVIAARKGVAL